MSDFMYENTFGQRFQIYDKNNYFGWGVERPWVPPIQNVVTIGEAWERRMLLDDPWG